MDYLLHLDLPMKCEYHVIDAISDDPKLTDAIVRFQ